MNGTLLRWGLIVLILILTGCSGSQVASVEQSPMSGEFIKGVDISTLQAIEDAGGKYFDDGEEKDLLNILKDHGVNYIRLRLWNDPVEADGYNDKTHLVAMAKRVKEKGLKLLVDFHYSDFWADPGKQVKPVAWENLSEDDLKQAIFDYTAEVMNELKQAGAYPDMVQIGNEITPGMLLPSGSTNNWKVLALLLGSGIRAVGEGAPSGHETKIMLHVDTGGDNNKSRSFFDSATAQEVDFDIIGLSYYPYWHGAFSQLESNMNDLAERYDKDIVVVETAYPFTLDDGDGYGNIAGPNEVKKGGYPASVEGQKEVILKVMNTVASVTEGKGIGVFYWEPAWIPVPKDANNRYQAGWRSGEGNAWDNQAMFDFQGNTLPSLDVFRFEPNNSF